MDYTVVFDHYDLDYSRIERACVTHREYRQLLNRLELQDPRRAAAEAGLLRARQQIETARVDLDRQREAEIVGWAKPRGLLSRINWTQWRRQA